jgi:hypothetical protein
MTSTWCYYAETEPIFARSDLSLKWSANSSLPIKYEIGPTIYMLWEDGLDAAMIALMMEAVSTSETSVNIYQTTRRNIPEDSNLHTSRRENLKSYQDNVN